MTDTIDKELNSYIDQLNLAQKKSLPGFIKTIFPGRDSESTTIKQYNKDLDDAEAEIERGETYSHEEAKKYLKEIVY